MGVRLADSVPLPPKKFWTPFLKNPDKYGGQTYRVRPPLKNKWLCKCKSKKIEIKKIKMTVSLTYLFPKNQTNMGVRLTEFYHLQFYHLQSFTELMILGLPNKNWNLIFYLKFPLVLGEDVVCRLNDMGIASSWCHQVMWRPWGPRFQCGHMGRGFLTVYFAASIYSSSEVVERPLINPYRLLLALFVCLHMGNNVISNLLHDLYCYTS